VGVVNVHYILDAEVNWL